MADMGHSRIDILKLDIEGRYVVGASDRGAGPFAPLTSPHHTHSEWQTLEQMAAVKTFAAVDQILIEVHFWSDACAAHAMDVQARSAVEGPSVFSKYDCRTSGTRATQHDLERWGRALASIREAGFSLVYANENPQGNWVAVPGSWTTSLHCCYELAWVRTGAP